jgi:hypothetical protein
LSRKPPPIPPHSFSMPGFATHPCRRIVPAATLPRQAIDNNQPGANLPASPTSKHFYSFTKQTRKKNHTMLRTQNTEYKDVAYRCGQLFAAISHLQCIALGRVDVSIGERIYSGVAKRPVTMFGSLFTKVPTYLRKVDSRFPGSGIIKQKELKTLTCKIENLGGFPKLLDNKGQNRFAMGYHEQLRKYRTDSKKCKTVKNTGKKSGTQRNKDSLDTTVLTIVIFSTATTCDNKRNIIPCHPIGASLFVSSTKV